MHILEDLGGELREVGDGSVSSEGIFLSWCRVEALEE